MMLTPIITRATAFISVVVVTLVSTQTPSSSWWCCYAQNPSSSVQDLLSQMTIEEKIGQMSQVDLAVLLIDDPDNKEGNKIVSKEKAEYYFGELGVGSVLNAPLNGVQWTASQYRTAAITIHDAARKYNRPPVIWGLDSVHGANYIRGAILTPQQINLAATFNRTVAYEAGRLASRDTRAAGISWLFSPILGLALEPKWSRVYETFGEDPHLVSVMGVEIIRGIQAPDEGGGGSVPSRAAACAKHYVGYSMPRDGHDRAPSWIPKRHLYQYFLVPWKAAISPSGGNVMTVMESYTEYDGVPNVANTVSLWSILRNELHFEGMVVTDYQEIENLSNWHHIVDDMGKAAPWALREGSVDMSMIPFDMEEYRGSILAHLQGVRGGESASGEMTTEKRIDESAQRVLMVKEKLGLFDEQLTTEDANIDRVGSDADRAAALEMARQSIVLVKNNGEALPISPTERVKIHITGPTSHALRYQSGGWTIEWQGAPDDALFVYGTTVLDAAMEVTEWDVSHSCGVDILGEDCAGDGRIRLDATLASSIERASKAAAGADYVVVCIGEENYTEKPGDIRSLSLPSGQHALVDSVKKTSKGKVILVYFGGRPRLLGDMVENADAVFICFLPGPDAGRALIDLITGNANPSGRLPLTYPKYEDEGGLPYFHGLTDKCTGGDGAYVACEVQWPFGLGLTYTSFEYWDLTVSSDYLVYTAPGRMKVNKKAEEVNVLVKIKNVGPRVGCEVVLFFTFDESRHVTPEYKRLRSFDKVCLKPGEETVVETKISLDDVRYIGPHDESHLVLEDGMKFRIGVGSQTDCRDIDNSDVSSKLCTDPVTVNAGEDYVGACDAACASWAASGCDVELSLSPRKCWESCTSVDASFSTPGGGLEGWGWNYVDCIEDISQGMNAINVRRGGNNHECWKMISMCRDIFHTPMLDEYGNAAHGPDEVINENYSPFGSVAAILSGITGLAIILLAFRARIPQFSGQRRAQADVYGNTESLEFTSLAETPIDSVEIS